MSERWEPTHRGVKSLWSESSPSGPSNEPRTSESKNAATREFHSRSNPADRDPHSRFAAVLKILSETHIESPENLPKRGLSFRGVLRFAEAKRKLYHPFPAFSFLTSLRSLRQFAAPHLTGARHSATATTLHTRGDAGCTKAPNSGYMLCSLQECGRRPFRVREKHLWSGVLSRSSRAGALTMVRRARSVIAKPSSGCAYHGRACVQCYNATIERVRLPFSGLRAALERSSRAGALSIVKRARTQQSGGCACHGQACADCCNEALTMVRRAITKQSSGCGYHGQACAQCQGEAVVPACYAELQGKSARR